MTGLRPLHVLRQNVTDLLLVRHLTQTDAAKWLGKDKSWINKFIKGTRQIQIKDLGRLADILGVQTYQLFQPGIARSTERRAGVDRRKGRERRLAPRERFGGIDPFTPSTSTDRRQSVQRSD